jgi:hypothetical protein
MMPIGNVAWRVALSSAVAGALACGLIALMVSRGDLLIVRPPLWTHKFRPKEEGRLGVACGCVAGLGFGFDGGFWKTAVVPEPWPLSMLLLALALCLLMKWAYGPDRRRCLYGASFVYGLTVSNSQALFAAALGLQILVLLTDRRLVRDTCLANSLLFGAGLWAGRPGYGALFHARVDGFDYLRLVFVLAGIGSVVTALALVIRTRRLSGEWRAVSTCCAMFLFGLSVYLYSPLASMTNPPVNWAYPRTAEGFIHLVTRGQYERIEPTASLKRLAAQLRMYGELAATDFGILYLMAALLPFCFLHRMRTQERNWMLGLLAVYLCLVLLLLVVLNPSRDRFSRETSGVFFSASHLVLAVWAGYGLILFGWLAGGRRQQGRRLACRFRLPCRQSTTPGRDARRTGSQDGCPTPSDT